MKSEPEIASRSYKYLVVPICCIVVSWIAWAFWLYPLPSCLEAKAQFGDAFGGLNTLFSGLAFASIIYGMYLQRLDLRIQQHNLELQREEMALQREEMKLQREEMTASTNVLREQEIQLAQQNRSALIAAKLAALPLLIEHECSALRKIGYGDLADAPTLDNVVVAAHQNREALRAQQERVTTATKKLQSNPGSYERIYREDIREGNHSSLRLNAASANLERLRNLVGELDQTYRSVLVFEQGSDASSRA